MPPSVHSLRKLISTWRKADAWLPLVWAILGPALLFLYPSKEDRQALSAWFLVLIYLNTISSLATAAVLYSTYKPTSTELTAADPFEPGALSTNAAVIIAEVDMASLQAATQQLTTANLR